MRRAAGDPTKSVWSWPMAPYGDTPALEDPDGDGAKTVLNLRYPGQYYDAFSGLHYNHTRYFSPRTGRYLQPDLIGLEGGTNVYTYANGNPVSYTDPTGTSSEGCGCFSTLLDWFNFTWTVTTAMISEMTEPSQSEQKQRETDVGDKHPSTPTGQRGAPMDVPKGTNQPATIGEREYGGHSLDQMQGRGVPPSAVEDAITNGTSVPDKTYPDSRIQNTSLDGRVIVITDRDTGRVITVITK